MDKLIIIGGGASGIIAALNACKKYDVTIIDSNDKLGKKLLLTGNNKCNFYNDDININKYYTDDYDLLDNILSYKNEVFNYLLSLGIYPINKDGLYYPYSMTSSSIQKLFENAIKKNNIKVLYNYKCLKIDKKDNGFIINDELKCNKLIIATGLKAYPKTGSDGTILSEITKLKQSISPVLPALTYLTVNDNITNHLKGLRVDIKASLFIEDKYICSEEGQLQINDGILSGICIFNLSSKVSHALYENKKVSVKINFIYFMNNPTKYFNESNLSFKDTLESILNYKITNELFKHIDLNKQFNSYSKEEKNNILNILTNYTFNITGTGSFDTSQVCSGGVYLKDIDNNMKSKIVNNLSFCGEVLNVDGICGGYNLAFAFITGYIAGNNI